MNSDVPKVLHAICGRPMLTYALDACRDAGVERLLVVVGHHQEKVRAAFSDRDSIAWIEQSEQRGTGHAVMCCRDALADFEGSVVVLAGDMPLVRRATVSALLESREESGHAAVLGTAILDEPAGYGRIVRDEAGQLASIVEDRDCTPEQREIREVNPSFYCFDARSLFDTLAKVRPNNAKGEYYVTDVVHLLREAGAGVSAYAGVLREEALGINSRMDLATVSRAMQDRIQLELLDGGVTIVDPDNTWVEAGCSIGRDTIILPFTYIGGDSVIGEGCRIGPLALVGREARIEADSQVAGLTRN